MDDIDKKIDAFVEELEAGGDITLDDSPIKLDEIVMKGDHMFAQILVTSYEATEKPE